MLLIVSLFGISTVFAYAEVNNTLLDQPLPSFSVLTDYVNSNRYTQTDNESLVVSPNQIDPTDDVIATELGTVYLDKGSLSFMIENDNGYLWSSTIDYENSGLSSNWQKRVRSAVHLYAYNTNTTNNSRTEEFVMSENSSNSTQIIENGFESTITFGISRIKILLRVQFLSDGIHVTIPDEHIVESGSFKIASLYVYPYFGATREDSIPGYMFLPDGVGALIRYQGQTNHAQYSKSFYNTDLGFNTLNNLNQLPEEGTNLYAPVFGFVHGINQNAVFANIIEGAEYGNLTVNFAGVLTDYNSIFVEYVYRKIYNQPIDRAGNVITLMQAEKNSFDIHVVYSLLEDETANYVGMAQHYQRYLDDKGDLVKQAQQAIDVPLKLESIGLVKKDGILLTDAILMTSFDDLIDMIDDLNPDINRFVVAFSGFTSAGVSWDAPVYKGLSSEVGDKADIEALKTKVETLYLVSEFVKASNRSGDYQAMNDLAKKINEQTYRFEAFDDDEYILKHSKVMNSFHTTTSYYENTAIDGFALTTIGSLLYENFSSHESKPSMIAMFNDMMADVDQKFALYDSRSYMWGQMDDAFDTPLYSSQYISFTDTVPFIQIVLRGYIDMYGPNANFYDYARDQLLRSIDYGMYVSFMVTQESSRNLQDTALNDIYTSRFDDLKPAIKTYYEFINGALKPVYGMRITNRTMIEPGLVKVDYENGYSIIINYQNDVKNYQTHQVNEKNYIVLHLNQVISGNYEMEGL
jgi:hypothetical protein